MRLGPRDTVTRAARARWLAATAWLLLGAAPVRAQAPVEPAAPAADSSRAAPGAPATDADSALAAPAAAPDAADPNARPTSVHMVRLVSKSENVVRSGPGDRYSIVGVYEKGRAFPVVAKNGDWFGIRVSETQTGWVHASLCKEFDDLSNLEFRPNPKLYTRTGSYILSAYGGAYSFDRKSNSLVLGGRLGYYVFDRVQAEAGLAWTHVHRPAEVVESLFGLSLEAGDFHMLFYNLNLTWEVLPGRQMVPFVTGGAGSTIMLGKSEPSVNFGAGTLLYFSKRHAMRWEFRDYRFHSGAEGARRENNNVEFTLSTIFLL